MKNAKKKEVVWITGASSGIGKGLVIEYFKAGFRLLVSARNEAALLELQKELNAESADFQIITFDLANTQNIQEKVDKAMSFFNRIDVLLNVGGLSQRSLTVETPIEIYRQIMEVNFFGTVALTNAVLAYMLKQGGGTICGTSSIVGKFGFPLRSAYSASKHALHGYFETLRAENQKNNIKVSVIIPGRINTNISVNALTKTGSSHGKLDEGQANGMSVEKASKIIFKGIEKHKTEILVGGKELIMVHLRRFLPKIAYRMAAKVKPT